MDQFATFCVIVDAHTKRITELEAKLLQLEKSLRVAETALAALSAANRGLNLAGAQAAQDYNATRLAMWHAGRNE